MVYTRDREYVTADGGRQRDAGRRMAPGRFEHDEGVRCLQAGGARSTRLKADAVDADRVWAVQVGKSAAQPSAVITLSFPHFFIFILFFY